MAKYLGFDVGSKTVGISKSDGFVASNLTTIRFIELDFNEAMLKLKTIIEEQKPEEIAVGWPKNMNGSEGHRVEMVQDFMDQFQSNFTTKLVIVDERLTTKMAKSIMIEANLSRKKQKQNKDGLAAILILETFLMMKKNNIVI